MQKLLITLSCWLALSLSVNAQAKPDEATHDGVKGCRYLASVEGNSGYGKNMGWKPLAKNSALSKAQQLNATHVVWTDFKSVGAFNGVATANAYNCNP